MKIVIRETVIDYIKTHALMNRGNEIFGWLIGSEIKGTLCLECAVSSHRYMMQNVIAAEPDLTETATISSVLPLGLGIIGMYHSHPVEVFHSATDDRTLTQLSILYSDAVSIVTNGKDFIVYQMDGEKSVEVDYKPSKKITNSFQKIVFNIRGRIKSATVDPDVNDIVTAIEKSIREKFDNENELKRLKKELLKGKNISINVEISLDEDMPVKKEEKWFFDFQTVLDVSTAKFEQKETIAGTAVNSLLMNILLQLKSLSFELNDRKLVITSRKEFLFQDIPFHVYLDSGTEITPMHQFLKDMELRAAILEEAGFGREAMQLRNI